MTRTRFSHLLLLVSLIFGSVNFALAENSVGVTTTDYFSYSGNKKIIINDVNLLEINDEIKAVLDEKIRPIKSKEKKVFALHKLLFSAEKENIRYHFTSTKTAQKTYDSKLGDCLSHAALFVAAARYLGLNAIFQSVHIPRRWEKQDNFLVVPGHLNVLVKLPSGVRATVEFAGTMLDNDALKSKKLDDKAALSEYYNNKGAKALGNSEYDLAIAYFEKSISIWKKSKNAWSNLGITYKILGEYEKSENSYLKALKIDSRNVTTIHNLYALYQLTHQETKAEKYFKRAERYAKKNPYSLFKLAKIDYSSGNFRQAHKSLKNAIKLKSDDPEFHHTLAKVYYKLNKKEDAIAAIKNAKNVAKTVAEKTKYGNKIKGLLSLKM